MSNIVYVLTNEAMPGYVKIGITNNLEQRIRSLDNTSTPLPFECFYACRVQDARETERLAHDAFLDTRVRSSREFFEISPDRVVSALKLAAIEDVTPKQDYVESEEDQSALNQARSRRSMFNFKMASIPVGSFISYIHDENIVAKVISNKKIEFQGEETSLSKAAQKLLGYSYQVQGTIYWSFEGETLDERRRRLENED